MQIHYAKFFTKTFCIYLHTVSDFYIKTCTLWFSNARFERNIIVTTRVSHSIAYHVDEYRRCIDLKTRVRPPRSRTIWFRSVPKHTLKYVPLLMYHNHTSVSTSIGQLRRRQTCIDQKCTGSRRFARTSSRFLLVRTPSSGGPEPTYHDIIQCCCIL